MRTAQLAAAFAERYGRAPDGIWAAPGRVNLIGEHTDYNDGYVLPVALDRLTCVAATVRRDGAVRVASTSEPEPAELAVADLAPDRLAGWAAYPLGVLWALREAGVALPGLDLLVDSTVPTGAGVSSSAALEAAVAVTAAELAGADLDRVALAQACRRAENEAVGAPTGVMDQMAALLGRAGTALFLDCRSLAVEHVPLRLDRAGLRLVVIDTRAAHALVDGAYADRRRACEEAARRLGVPALRDATLEQVEAELAGELRRRARHVVTEDARVLAVVDRLRAGDPAGCGPLWTASHASMRDDFEISCPELDTAVAAATSAGALGARMTGGGFGGSAVALVPAAALAGVPEVVRQAFAAAGYDRPEVFEVEPGDGARRVQ